MTDLRPDSACVLCDHSIAWVRPVHLPHPLPNPTTIVYLVFPGLLGPQLLLPVLPPPTPFSRPANLLPTTHLPDRIPFQTWLRSTRFLAKS